MYAPQASCGVVFVKLSFHVMGFAFRLKLAQVFQHALPFGRRCLFFFGGFSFFPEIALSLGNLTVVVFYYGFCLLVGHHEQTCIGIVAPPLEQLHPQICPIQIVLRHSQVSSCHLIIAVVIDMHDDNRRDFLTRPSVVAPCFSQTVAGDLALHAYSHYRRMDDPPSLYSADGLTLLAVTHKNKIAAPVWEVQAQRLEDLFVKGDGLGLLGFLLDDGDVGAESIM